MPPQLSPPTSEEYAQLFTRLGMENETIISIHASEEVAADYCECASSRGKAAWALPDRIV